MKRKFMKYAPKRWAAFLLSALLISILAESATVIAAETETFSAADTLAEGNTQPDENTEPGETVQPDENTEPEETYSCEAPDLLSAVNKNAGLVISWEASEGAAGYRLYRKAGEGDWKAVSDLSLLSYTDTSAAEGKDYSYTVCCLDQEGNPCSSYDSDGIQVRRLTTPVLTGVDYTITGMRVSWQACAGAQGYYVYRKTAGVSWTRVAETSGTSTVIYGGNDGDTYYFTVKAYYGNSRSFYNTKGVSIVYHAAPQITSVSNGTMGVVLNWKGSLPKGSKYRVYRKTTGSWVRLCDTTSNNFTDKDASSGTSYSYTIRLVNSDGNKWLSSCDSTDHTIVRLSRPELKSLACKYSGQVLTWSAVSGAKGYYVYRKTAGEKWTRIGETTKCSFTESEGTNNTSYFYTVRAFSGTSRSAYDAAGLSLLWLDAPLVTSLTNTSGGTTLKWKAVEGAAGYGVYRKAAGGTWKFIGRATSAAYTDTKAVSGTKYQYTVRCTDSKGTKVLSTYTEGKTILYLEAPTVSLSHGAGRITLSWNAVSGASSYYIYRKTSSASSWTRIKTTNQTSWTDTDVSEGVTYSYTLRAVSSGQTSAYRAGKSMVAHMFYCPIQDEYYISSKYGYRTCPYHGPEFHGGLDMACPCGTNIYAAESGTVTVAGYSSSWGYYIKISHGADADGNTWVTQYNHCKSLKVSVGDTVTWGQVIGYVGMTGNATGYHLDFRIYKNGSTVNPTDYITN